MILIVLLVSVVIWSDYKCFIRGRKKEISSFPKISLSTGEVSYIDINPDKEEVILFCTGGGVGFDSVLAFEWLKNTNFRIICVNRGGYHGLPLQNSFEEHIDTYDEVLEHLGIKEVSVFGISMGGVAALLYTKKYGAKKLLLWSAITKSYLPNSESTNTGLGKLVMNHSLKDMISYFLMRSAQMMPITTSAEFFCASAHISKAQAKAEAREMMKDRKAKREFLNFVKTMTPMSDIFDGMMKEVDMTKDLVIDLSEIKVPCLAVHSVLDKDVPISHLEYLEKHLSHIRTITTKGLGHYVWWGEGSHAMKEESIQFLKGNL